MTTTTARQFINGKLVGSKQESTSTSPADGSSLGCYADADEEQAKEAVAAARTAFADTDWCRDRRLRHQVLSGIADAIERCTDELVSLLARENGKVLAEGGFELSLTVPKLRYYAAEVAPGLHMSSVPEPIGVAGAGAGAVLNVARPEPGSTIVVFGAGGVGLVAVMAAGAHAGGAGHCGGCERGSPPVGVGTGRNPHGQSGRW
jgi:hypothetical protein